MLSRSLAGGVVLLAALTLVPASASALSLTRGDNLSRPSDAGFGCETRWTPGYPPDFTYQPFVTGPSTCTMWSLGSEFATPAGTITKVRVRSGPNPAPLRVIIIRALYQTNPNNPNEITDQQCCTGVVEGPVFQPTPNAVTESVVNLPVQVVKAQGRLSGWSDGVAVSGVGPGQMPLASTGPHTSDAATTAATPKVEFSYPKNAPGTSSGGSWQYPNYQPLIQFDWQSCPAGASARASQACKPVAPVTPKNPKGRAMASISGKSLRMRKGKVSVKVKCSTLTKARCKGKVRLYTRPKKGKAKLLAGKSVNLADGKSKRYSLKLGRKARKRVKKKSNKVQVRVGLGKTLGTVTKNMTLKR
ncbi:MAG TPA: hypothetical protein VEX39_02305 [Thermoleophilaceae bacterium]|nr:hypothetical protein [Thermoleophilaceae bacterium]